MDKGRNVPRQPQSKAQVELGKRLMADALARAEKLAALQQQQPLAWRKDSDSDDSQECGL